MTDRAAGYWANFPRSYRQEQIAEILRWVSAGESGVIIGCSGSGKSNLVGFLREWAPTLLPDRVCFVSLDSNSLPALEPAYFYRGMFHSLQEAAAAAGPEIGRAADQLADGLADGADLFLILTRLQRLHRLVIGQAGRKVVWLLDRFDEACRRMSGQSLSNLRHLRDQFKGSLCYLPVSRHPLSQLRPTDEIDEFHEIVVANSCRVGPMAERDARWVIRQMGERLAITIGEAETEQLVRVSGGLPALLKAACIALAAGTLTLGQSGREWATALLTRPEFQRICRSIWDDLAPAEQAALINLVRVDSNTAPAETALTTLRRAGLVAQSGDERSLRPFSPIFTAFIARQQLISEPSAGRQPPTPGLVYHNIPLRGPLTAQESLLLDYFLAHPEQVCEKRTLIEAIWPGEQPLKGVRDDRLTQLVRRLRGKIEPDPARPTYIKTVRGKGYRFCPPG